MEEHKKGISGDIFIAEINLALDNLLRDKVFTLDAFGRQKAVPIFFRDRDSKLVADTTPDSLISIAFVNYDKADGVFWNQCGGTEVIKEDADGNPLMFKISGPADPIVLRYIVTARSQHWDDMIKVETALAKFFPVTHGLLKVGDTQTHLFRTGYQLVDDAQLGIFERNISLEIIGYLFPDKCKDEIAYGIKSAILEVSNTADPDREPIEILDIIEEC